MNKHINILTQLLIKQYPGNDYLISWERAGENLRLYRIGFMIFDYLKD